MSIKFQQPVVISGLSTGKRVAIATLFILFVIALLGCGYFYKQYRSLRQDPAIIARQQTEETLIRLARVMVVPRDTNPMIATVTDKTKLANDPFFTLAENGDAIIVFPTDMRAVLFRSSTGQVVNIAPVSKESQQTSGTLTSPQKSAVSSTQESVTSTKATTKKK